MRRLSAVPLLAAALVVAGCSEEPTLERAQEQVREQVSGLSEELGAAADEARQRLGDLPGDLRGPVDSAIEDAEQAARDAENALPDSGQELDEAGRQRLEDARAELEQAQQRLSEATDRVPGPLREAFSGVDEQLAELRERVERSLEG